jgi:hypothetical protein
MQFCFVFVAGIHILLILLKVGIMGGSNDGCDIDFFLLLDNFVPLILLLFLHLVFSNCWCLVLKKKEKGEKG